jgi:hypothetical protein
MKSSQETRVRQAPRVYIEVPIDQLTVMLSYR